MPAVLYLMLALCYSQYFVRLAGIPMKFIAFATLEG